LNDPSGVPEIEITDVNKDSPPPNTSPVIIQKEKFPDEDALVDTKGREEKNRESTPQRHPDTFTENALARSRGVETAPKKVTIPRNPSEEIIHEKIAEIVAQVEVLEKENSTVTDAEIDSLLRNAQRQILEDKMFRKDRSVDAMALLADVEDELDRSFRDEIFDALKDGFLKVRTAVADRNR
jgi:acyl carrier protein